MEAAQRTYPYRHSTARHWQLRRPSYQQPYNRVVKEISQRINQPRFVIMGRAFSSLDLAEYTIKAVAVTTAVLVSAYAASGLLSSARSLLASRWVIAPASLLALAGVACAMGHYHLHRKANKPNPLAQAWYKKAAEYKEPVSQISFDHYLAEAQLAAKAKQLVIMNTLKNRDQQPA